MKTVVVGIPTVTGMTTTTIATAIGTSLWG
jgi:hypothetical protein